MKYPSAGHSETFLSSFHEEVERLRRGSMADDGHQLILSSMADLISARRVTIGSRSTEWLGQMSDASL